MKEMLSNKMNNTITVQLIDEKTGEVQETVTKNIVTKAGKQMLHYFLSNQLGAMFNNVAKNVYMKNNITSPDDAATPSSGTTNYHINFPIGSVVLSSNDTPINAATDHKPPEVLQYMANPSTAPTFEEQVVGWLDFDAPVLATADVKKGVLNRAESEITNDTIKFVVDFSTSEANGEINSIMLRTGRGSEIGRDFNEVGNLTSDLEDYRCYVKALNKIIYFSPTQNYLYSYEDVTFADVEEMVKHIALNGYTPTIWASGNVVPDTDYDIKDVTYDVANKIMYVLTMRYYSSSYTPRIYAYDMTDPTSPVKLGYTAWSRSSLPGQTDSNASVATHDRIYYNNDNQKLYYAYNTHDTGNTNNEFRVVEIDDTNPIGLVVGATVLTETGYLFSDYYSLKFGNEIYWQNGKAGEFSAFESASDSAYIWKFDFKTLTTEVWDGPIPGVSNTYSPTIPIFRDADGEPLVIPLLNGAAKNTLFGWGNLTRAVLPTPVTKLNTQTMKVTYELQFI